MKNGLLILLLSAGLFQSSAQTIVTTSTPDKSVDYTGLARIDTLVNEYVNKGAHCVIYAVWKIVPKMRYFS